MSIPPPNEANMSISDTEQVSDDNTQQLQDLPVSTCTCIDFFTNIIIVN